MTGCGRIGISLRGACLLIGLSGIPSFVRPGLRPVGIYFSSVVRLYLLLFSLTPFICLCSEHRSASSCCWVDVRDAYRESAVVRRQGEELEEYFGGGKSAAESPLEV
ncbi:hypothetical protein ACOSQ3_022471 [Xanthoceras sorbifolium]